MATRKTTSRSGASKARGSAKTQIIEMLKADHKKAKKAFKDFEKMEPEEAQGLVEQCLAELEVHADLEEQVFYPAARQAIKEEDLLDEAEVEHMTAKTLIQQLHEMTPQDEKYAATFKVLGEYINHHVKEEEKEMFEQITGRGVDWDQVLEQMQQRRMELMQEKGLEVDEEMEEAVPVASSRSRSAGMAGRAGRGASESRPQAAQGSSSDGSEKE